MEINLNTLVIFLNDNIFHPWSSRRCVSSGNRIARVREHNTHYSKLRWSIKLQDDFISGKTFLQNREVLFYYFIFITYSEKKTTESEKVL